MTVLLLDTYSLFFRSFHALPPMNTTRGEPTRALYGLSVLLLKLLREERPQGLAFAIDRPEPTFRHQAYAGYKATRERVPSELSSQFGRLAELIDALGFPHFAVPGFEADDVLATLASELENAGTPALIVTGDRDLLQLVSESVQVLFVGQRGKPPTRYDRLAAVARFGITPERLPVYVSLVGDVSDNVPKVKGIGPVAAQKIAAEFASMDALFAGLERVEGERVRALLRTHEQQLRASELLVRLRRDVPLPAGERHRPLTTASIERTRALFEELEFQSLIARLSKLTPAS